MSDAVHAHPGKVVTLMLPVPPDELNNWLVGLIVYAHEVVNVAVKVVSSLIVTLQVPVPEHPPPDHPVKVEPEAGVAVRITKVPEPKGWEQTLPHVMPVGELDTVPVPLPLLATVSA